MTLESFAESFGDYDDDWKATLIPALCMRTILSAHIGKDDGGYDLIQITLDDGSIFQIHERGQCGWFATSLHTTKGEKA
jgi:hypothetical protein